MYLYSSASLLWKDWHKNFYHHWNCSLNNMLAELERSLWSWKKGRYQRYVQYSKWKLTCYIPNLVRGGADISNASHMRGDGWNQLQISAPLPLKEIVPIIPLSAKPISLDSPFKQQGDNYWIILSIWNCEILRNICAPYIVCQTEHFHLRTVKFCKDHHKTHTSEEKPEVASSNSKDATFS